MMAPIKTYQYSADIALGRLTIKLILEGVNIRLMSKKPLGTRIG